MAKMSKAENEALANTRWTAAMALAQMMIYSRPDLRSLPTEAHVELSENLAAAMLEAGFDYLAPVGIEDEISAADMIALPTAGTA